MLTANKIHRTYVGEATPFHLWLTIEKQNFLNKKGINADENVKKFELWLNKRYIAGGTSFWQRYYSRVVKEAEPSNGVVELNAVKVPFLKKEMVMGMTPVSFGLIAVGVIAASIATIQIIKYLKRNKK